MRTQEKRGRLSTTAVGKEDVCMAGFSGIRMLCRGFPHCEAPNILVGTSSPEYEDSDKRRSQGRTKEEVDGARKEQKKVC